ncbi:MAG TPA: hypothetical protein VK807_23845 [Gemmatimonadaceae bacterium]|jgi:hypothetical protein|nr:hypothetical protein [Gemmatimonadaceae bacterium]
MSSASKRDSAVLTVVTLALMALVLWNSIHKSLWTDESYSLNTAMRPLAGTMHQALHFELQPPLFFVALNLWLRVHDGIIFARLLSLGCILGMLTTLAAIGRLIGIRGWLTPAVLAAATPGIIWAAAEARVYGMSLLLATVTLYWYLRIVVGPPEHLSRSTLIYAVVAYLSVFTFYYNAFLLLGQWIGALVIGRQVRRVTGALGLVAIGIVPWIPTILSQGTTHPIEVPVADQTTIVSNPLFVLAGQPIKALLTDTAGLVFPHAVIIIWAILAIVPALRIAFGGKATAAERALIPLVVMPLVVLCALMYLHRIPMRHRHLVLLLPATLTLYSLWIAQTRAGWPRALGATSLVALLVAFIVSFEIDPQYPEDWRQVADYLVRQMTPGDHVLVFDPDRVLPLQYYLGHGAAVSGLPVDPDLDHYDPSQYATRDTTILAARFAAVDATGGVWLVEANRLMPALQSSTGVIDGFVRRHYVVRPPLHFRGVLVTHLEPRSYAR